MISCFRYRGKAKNVEMGFRCLASARAFENEVSFAGVFFVGE